MEWRIRTGKRMNTPGDNPFNGASISTAPTAPRGLLGCAEFVRSRRRAINVISKERQHDA
ncbi:hypothetical protein N9417_05605 [Pseudomonadales bacterium]|nr:hypothetical protein [Pseudomonadales bacterium]